MQVHVVARCIYPFDIGDVDDEFGPPAQRQSFGGFVGELRAGLDEREPAVFRGAAGPSRLRLQRAEELGLGFSAGAG